VTEATLAQRVHGLAELPPDERDEALRTLLRTDVHDAVMQLTVDSDEMLLDDLRELGELIRTSVPDDTENRLPVRVRVFVRLLRRGAYEPAWTLAHDNASGVVRPTRATSMWAGGSFLTSRLPLPTHLEDGRVYAWLPGFRDPRYGVPDDVYAIDSDVVLRGDVDLAELRGPSLRLYGTAYLGLLDARPQGRVALALAGPDGAAHRVDAARVRRPDHVKPSGPDLTRLAWAGWHAEFDLAPLLAVPGTWRINVEVDEQGVQRSRPLGRSRGPLAAPELFTAPARRIKGLAVRLDNAADGALVLRISRMSLAARVVPAPLRRVLRRLRSG
jgi:hypothetical protein